MHNVQTRVYMENIQREMTEMVEPIGIGYTSSTMATFGDDFDKSSHPSKAK